MKDEFIQMIFLFLLQLFTLILIAFSYQEIDNQKQTITDLSDRLSYVEGSLRIYS